jgi:hypothetical protein
MVAPASASKWRMGFNPYPANVDKMVAPASASKWRMGFNLAFKGLRSSRSFIEKKASLFCSRK